MLIEAAGVSLKMNPRTAVADWRKKSRTSVAWCQRPCALQMLRDSCVEAATSPALTTMAPETMLVAAALVKTAQRMQKGHKAAAAGLTVLSTGGRTAATTMQFQGLMGRQLSW